jgi:LDH2 family malate/lactate/ureidoglycolate dehydrogenase
MIVVPRFTADQLQEICVEILNAVGVPEDEAGIVSNCLVAANLRGVDSHGIVLLPRYVRRVRGGMIRAKARINVIRESPSTVLLDGGSSLGPVIGVKAMQIAIDKAKTGGICGVAVSSSEHLGMLAYYSMLATKHDLIGITMSNTIPLMAAWGGKSRVIGNNPMTFAFPTKTNPIVLDMATSAAAAGKIRIAKLKGEKLAEGWAIDKYGQPTTDPNAVIDQTDPDSVEGWIGALLPMGGHKGYGLSVVVDLFCGVLTGAKCSPEMSLRSDPSSHRDGGAFVAAINIETFIPLQQFKERIDKFIKIIKGNPSVQGEIFLPGEIEFREEEKRRKEGILIPDKAHQEIEILAKELQLNLDTLS